MLLYYFAVGSLFSALDGIPFLVNERLKPPAKVRMFLLANFDVL